MNLALAIRNTHVNVQAKDQERTSDSLQFLNQQLVSLIFENLLVLPARNGMRRCSYDLEIILLSQRRDDTAQIRYVCARFLNVLTYTGADLDHRLNHLGLDLLAENHLAFVEKLRYV